MESRAMVQHKKIAKNLQIESRPAPPGSSFARVTKRRRTTRPLRRSNPKRSLAHLARLRTIPSAGKQFLRANIFIQRKTRPSPALGPNNAVPHLLAAEILAKPPRVEPLDMLIRRKSKVSREKSLLDDPQWAAEMHAAFTAPNYDNYATQLVELIRNVSSRFFVRDPEIALYVFSNRRIVHLDLLRGYADALTDRAASLENSGKTSDAIATCGEMLHFAQRMSLDGRAPVEQSLGQQIGEDAARKLAPLYDSTGHRDEASLLRFQLEKWNTERDPKILRYVPLHYRWSQWNLLAWSGLIITIAGFAIFSIVPITLIALFIVVRRRKTPPQLRGR